MSQKLDPATFDLWGSRLIEASAGTGKTWTIAALYLRLVLGHGAEHGFERALQPSEILVMTFTRAATRELSERIRERLLSAAKFFRNEADNAESDEFLDLLSAAYPDGPQRQRAAWALNMAAENMDDASIHTIDAWCQRMLKEHAFDSGNLFDEQLVADEELMHIEAAQDYWRQACYPLNSEQLALVLTIWKNVEALIQDMRDLKDQDIPAPASDATLGDVLTQAHTQRTQALQQLKQGWVERAQTMQQWLDGQTAIKKNGWDGRKLSAKHYTGWLVTLRDWASGLITDDKPDLKVGWERFTPAGLLEVRTADAPAIEFPIEFSQFAQLSQLIDDLPQVSVAARLHAAAQVAQRLLQLKRQSGSFGFSDMLHRLNMALHGENGANLRQRILAQYPVILIDEFQDTSPLQYQIFNQIYQTQSNDPRSALLLIGDPKQSIYGFRGADIYSYMQARRATTGRHYMLQTNYRSTQALVDVVNHCFLQAEQRNPQNGAGAFMYRRAADNPLPFVPVQASGRQEQFVTHAGPMPAMTLVHDLDLHNNDEMRQLFAARCAEQVATWLNDAQAGFAHTANRTFKVLRPADIAILVRTGKEAAAVQRELTRRRVASVYLSDKDSVFDSPEAGDLLHWLKAVAAPQEVRLVRAGLATRTVGLSLDELGWLASNDEAFDARCEQLRQLRTVWQLQGVLAMLRQTLHQLGLAARWLDAPDGERRLTNFLHLAELLQSASLTLDGEQALIRWLLMEMKEGNAHSDEQIVRLESDADLVKVITIYKSKGLEYPLVCLPYATSFRKKEAKSTSFINLAGEDGQRALQLQFSKTELALADQDRLREDLRLLYVALTRARHALWVGFAAVKVGKTCVSHESGMGYLLGGTEQVDPDGWGRLLTQFADNNPHIGLQAATAHTARSVFRRTESTAALHTPAPYQADFERNWTIGSFSGLIKNLAAKPNGNALSPLRLSKPADDEREWAEGAEALPASLSATPSLVPATWHAFTRGPESGNFLHEQLEWLAKDNFALPSNERLTSRLERSCERAGRSADTELVVAWLTQVVQTVLPGPDVALIELNNALPEMEFWLPAHRLEASAVDAQCRQHLLPGVPRAALVNRQLHGMLMGFMDLVFEHQGKYWVLDYKSNYLGQSDADYGPDALARVMAQHRYDVQAAIYLLALHRLLKTRLGDNYQPEQHLGGAVYLFLRGVQGPANGVCLIPVCVPLLEALDTLLLEKEASVC